MRRTRSLLVLAGASALALSACGGSDDEPADTATGDGGTTVVTVGAPATPHGEILQFVQDNLAADAGIEIEVVEYTDYVQPNVALSEGDLDANYFQHLPYLEAQVEERGYDFHAFTPGVHIEPLAVYSESVTDLADLPDGAQIGVSNDPANQARGLELLEANGVFTLADVEDPTIFDVADNPKNVELVETDPAQLPRSLQDLDAAVINGNYALEAGLVPAEDGLAVESGEDNPYANILVARSEDADNEALLTLQELLTSPEVADFIAETWPSGEIIAAF